MCNKEARCKGFTYIPSLNNCWLKHLLEYPTKPHKEALTYYKLHEGEFSIFLNSYYYTEERTLTFISNLPES